MFQNKNQVSNQASLGKSVHIKGDVSGSEDLVVHGRIEGRIDLKDHNLTVGPDGHVSAEIHVRNATISGHVRGDVVASEKVELAEKADLVGDIRSARWIMSDEAKFRGRVDMGQGGSD